MTNQVVASVFKYKREEALAKIKAKNWFINSNSEIKEGIEQIPNDFQGFMNELADRPDENEFYKINKMTDIYWGVRYAVPVFEVTSKKDGGDYVNSYMSWRKGNYLSLKGLLLIATQGKISHFLVKKSFRFAPDLEMYEAIGGIYPLEEIEDNSKAYEVYLQQELSEKLRIPKIKISKMIDLGKVYPDASMTDEVAKLFTAQIEVEDINSITSYIEGKTYIDHRYDYSFEVFPIEKLFKFLAETNDSFLLAIFGRLQALNVIKL